MSQAPSAQTTMERAVAAHRAGRGAEAEQLYRAVLREQPGHPDANHNLGVITAQRGDAAGSLPLFRSAVEAAPQQAPYWLSYARGLLIAGRPREALRAVDEARRRGISGSGVEALAAQAELAIDPDFADAHFRLGSVLSETGKIAEGFAHFMRRAELVYGPGATARPPPQKPEPPHKLKHDREQRDYLAGGKATGDAPAVGYLFRIDGGDRLAGAAVNPANATPALLERWQGDGPQMVVIDDFLTPQALEDLRRYCAGSTIWRRVYEAGYIGATPEDGFACPLLAQIAEEIQDAYPDIFGPHRFRYLGAFKYDSELSTGTNTHADNSAVNVNLYIAPDEANLDPASGGMEIWDVCAPDEATMRTCNGDEAAVRDLLRRSGARSTIVPHRANRAVIFKSALFHKTDRCEFREGYLNKRINVSLLFGDFGDPT